jgi:hypothetical protein
MDDDMDDTNVGIGMVCDTPDEKEIARQGKRIAVLELALAKYGRHDQGCTYDGVTGLCSCGLYTALTRKTIDRHNAAIRTER